MRIRIRPTKINVNQRESKSLPRNRTNSCVILSNALSYDVAEHLADILVNTHERKVRQEIGKKSKKVISVKVK
jgi:hypothetical protein